MTEKTTVVKRQRQPETVEVPTVPPALLSASQEKRNHGRLVTVVALVSHDSMHKDDRATVPYSDRVQSLIDRGYLDPAIDDDPLPWMNIE